MVIMQHILIAIELNLFQKIKKLKGNKNIFKNIYRILESDSIMCGYFCILFINLMLNDKSLLDYTNIFLLVNMKRIIK